MLGDLNEEQRMAVEYIDGAALVVAGAGSGKTRVLTYKIAYLLELGVKPWNILALTFTNKAAREMKSRIETLVGDGRAAYIAMGTFHSVFSRILRKEASHVGYGSGYTIYDEGDSRSLIKSITKEMGLDDKVYKPSTVHHHISMAKNHLILAGEYAADSSLIRRDREMRMPAMSSIYTAYCARCRQANAMDFDDLLTLTYVLFRDNDDIRRKYSEKYGYILVDEYQDTNTVQQRIMEQLSRDNGRRICVVGDDAQSIYGFRGANIDNILNFGKMFPGFKLFKLERNYRSTRRIVEAANSLIRHNERQIPKSVYSRNDEGEPLTIKHAYSDKEEALIVCNDILTMRRRDSLAYSSFAILYRTNAQSRTFEEAMRKASIPYRIYGGLSFYQRKEIKDIIAYFRLVANPDDEEALKRIINYPARGIGQSTLAKIAAKATELGISLWSVISAPGMQGINVSKATMTKLDNFRSMMLSFMENAEANAFETGQRIIKECGVYADIYSEKTPEAIARQENVEELFGGMQDFVESRAEEGRGDEATLTDYLQEVSLLTDLDSEGADDGERVSLMTIHSAKGLEFPVVFVVGMEENIFPSPLSTNSARELEEERRLLYVAITRAERRCILTTARNRFRYGRLEWDAPSRFLREIDPRLVSVEGSAGCAGYAGDIYGRHDTASSSARSFSHSEDNPQEWTPRSSVTSSSRLHSSSNRVGEKGTAAIGNTRETSRLKPMGEVQPAHSRPRSTHASAVDSQGVKSPSRHDGLTVGSIIEHERFGIGEVLSVEGEGENTKARVRFRNAGDKQLLLKFARFRIVSRK